MRYLLFIVLLFNTLILHAQKKPIVVGTTSMITDMAQNIFGDKAEVVCLVPVGGDPHLHEPTAKDAKLIYSAQVVLKNGLSLEGWLDKLIENSGTKADVVITTKGIDAIRSAEYNAPDPHAWMDAANGVIYSQNILEAAKKLIPADSTYFNENFEKYKTEIQKMDAYIQAEIQKIPNEKRILITSHDAFQYYGKKYGIQLESTLGTSTDADVQTSDIIQLQKLIQEKNIPAIFAETTINPKLIKQIAKDNNVILGGKLFADSLGEPNTSEGTYLGMMRYNTNTIVSNLLKEKSKEATAATKEEASNFNMVYLLIGAILLLIAVFIGLRKKNNS